MLRCLGQTLCLELLNVNTPAIHPPLDLIFQSGERTLAVGSYEGPLLTAIEVAQALVRVHGKQNVGGVGVDLVLAVPFALRSHLKQKKYRNLAIPGSLRSAQSDLLTSASTC